MAKAAIRPPPNVGVRNSARSNIGWSVRVSTTSSNTTNRPPRNRLTATPPSDQPVSLARVSPYTSPTNPTAGRRTRPSPAVPADPSAIRAPAT